MFRAFRAMLREPETKALALAAVAVVAIGTVVYVLVEHWSVLDAVYFCVVTLATIGYGDLHPTTDVGKAFTIVYILGGLGIIAAFITELARQHTVVRRVSPDDTSLATEPVAPAGERSSPGSDTGGRTIIDARASGRDPDSPSTDVGPGG